jgi:phosphatidylserine decarboxylase
MNEKQWPIAKEGLPFLIVSALLTLGVAVLGWTVPAILGGLLTLFIAFFFRNPRREIPDLGNIILSPADGKVVHVGEVREERLLKDTACRISIFMSPLNVHINRSPATGKVLDSRYHPGRFLVASKDKASLDNEQNALLLETEDKSRILVVQIAGFIARRIVCYVKAGDHLKMGQTFGLIRFGSRVDLYLPANAKPTVRVGQRVKGGESIVGYRV